MAKSSPRTQVAKVGLGGVALLFVSGCIFDGNPDEALVNAAQRLEHRSLGPAQWFEMQTYAGWEKMMLVFGYADNREVCDYLVRNGQETSPNRTFRCSPVN